ncbi:MAG: phosphoribosylglycinamide formyltransferase [Oscillospiraceae bacterium]
MLKAKIAVFVSGGGTNFEALINSLENGNIPHGDICLVVSSNRNAFALERAKNHNVKSVVVSKKELSSQDAFEKALLSVLKENSIDLIVLAGFMTILSESFTKKYDKRIINVHPSLIPSFCGEGFYGLKVHEAALNYGVKVTGATVHYVNEIPDNGEIILQKAVYIKDGDTPLILQKRVMQEAEWEILPKAAEITAKNIVEGSQTNENT